MTFSGFCHRYVFLSSVQATWEFSNKTPFLRITGWSVIACPEYSYVGLLLMPPFRVRSFGVQALQRTYLWIHAAFRKLRGIPGKSTCQH